MLKNFFIQPTEAYSAMSAEEYRKLVQYAQNEINCWGFVYNLVHDLKFELEEILDTDDIYAQRWLYLRATRPNVDGQEAVGWHREEMYGTPKGTWNFWMPALNVTPENAIKYIPGSENAEIEVVQEQDPQTPRGSAGHEIGLNYAPKRIVGGVDFADARPMPAGLGDVAVFNGSLIHGAAVNRTDKIRFSIDFRLISKENLKQQHYASGREYFAAI